MNDIVNDAVPEGFEQLPEGIGFTDVMQPFYRKVEEDSVSLGLLVEEHHANTMGICHGGVLMIMADIACTAGVNLVRGDIAGNPTLNLSIDFVAAAKRGEWIEAAVDSVDLKRRFGFCTGAIRSPRRTVARFSGKVYFPDHDGMWQDSETKAGVLGSVEKQLK